MSKQVNTRVPEELYRRLQSMASAVGLTVSALLRVAAVEYLDNHGVTKICAKTVDTVGQGC